MIVRNQFLGALAVLSALACAPVAEAAIVYTYKGTISSGTDYAGLLGGPANQALAGKAFTLTFTLDEAAAGIEYAPYPGIDQIVMHTGSTAMTGVMSIEGVDFDLGTLEDTNVAQSHQEFDPYTSGIMQEFFGHVPILDGSGDVYRSWANAFIWSESHPVIPLPVSYKSQFSYDIQPGDVGDGVFVRSRDNDDAGSFIALMQANLSFTNVTVVDTAAVPEPATWALMIAGFGAVGGALRRRRLATA